MSYNSSIKIEETEVDLLHIKKFKDRDLLGAAAAKAVGQKLRELQQLQGTINMVFAAAPSQNEFLTHLLAEKGIEWSTVNALHMDEYLGLSEGAPQSFGYFLKNKLFDKLPFKNIYYIDGRAPDIYQECERYEELIRNNPIDIVCMGIGENCHIAFNDPGVADFNDPKIIKEVHLEQRCRQQQVNDGCFSSIELVPSHALTLTVPALLEAKYIFCVVPGPTKAEAVRKTLCEEVSDLRPSSILRRHPNSVLFIDSQSSALVTELFER